MSPLFRMGPIAAAVAGFGAMTLAWWPAAPNRFHIQLDGDAPGSATVSVCGRTFRGTVGDTDVSGVFRPRCDDSPVITLTYPDRIVECRIGYVTSGMAQDWSFRVSDGECLPLEAPSA